ncbi:MAG: hypothetical protein WDW38_006807 [Sanguina aurantia]
MELGATVCKPALPNCGGCPVSHSCRAFQEWERYRKDGGSPDIEDAPRVTQYPGKKEKAAKREVSVAVCVMEMIDRATHTTTTTTTVTTTATTTVTAQPNSSAKAPAKKRQRSILDFAIAAKLQKGTGNSGEIAAPAAASGGDVAIAGSAASGQAQSALLLSAPRFHLMVQRPEEGLLAGLWEFPGVEFEGETTYSQRQSLSNSQLASLLQLPPSTFDSPRSSSAASKGKGKASATGPSPTISSPTIPPTSSTVGAAAAASAATAATLSDPPLVATAAAPAAGTASPTTDHASASATAEAAPPAEPTQPAPTSTQDPIKSESIAIQDQNRIGSGTGSSSSCGGSSCSGVQVISRHDLGTYIHIFSHIKQTNHVERLTIVVDDVATMMLRVTASRGGGGDAVSSAAAAASLQDARALVTADAGPCLSVTLDVDAGVEVMECEGSAVAIMGDSAVNAEAVTAGVVGGGKAAAGQGKSVVAKKGVGKKKGDFAPAGAVVLLPPLLRAVASTAIAGEGLSTGVKNILKLAMGG